MHHRLELDAQSVQGCEQRAVLLPGPLRSCAVVLGLAYVELRDGSLLLDTPKTAAGVRTVHLPPHLLPGLVEHLDRYATPRSPVILANGKDEPIRRASWRSVWLRARDHAGPPQFRLHDLRHTGNTLAAATGASTEELMARLGHASMRAALIDQHATADRDAALALALSRLATDHDRDATAESHPDGRPALTARGRARARATGTQRAVEIVRGRWITAVRRP